MGNGGEGGLSVRKANHQLETEPGKMLIKLSLGHLNFQMLSRHSLDMSRRRVAIEV